MQKKMFFLLYLLLIFGYLNPLHSASNKAQCKENHMHNDISGNSSSIETLLTLYPLTIQKIINEIYSTEQDFFDDIYDGKSIYKHMSKLVRPAKNKYFSFRAPRPQKKMEYIKWKGLWKNLLFDQEETYRKIMEITKEPNYNYNYQAVTTLVQYTELLSKIIQHELKIIRRLKLIPKQPLDNQLKSITKFLGSKTLYLHLKNLRQYTTFHYKVSNLTLLEVESLLQKILDPFSKFNFTRDLLIKIIQRGPRYNLFLDQLIKYTNPIHPIYKKLLRIRNKKIHPFLRRTNKICR